MTDTLLVVPELRKNDSKSFFTVPMSWLEMSSKTETFEMFVVRIADISSVLLVGVVFLFSIIKFLCLVVFDTKGFQRSGAGNVSNQSVFECLKTPIVDVGVGVV